MIRSLAIVLATIVIASTATAQDTPTVTQTATITQTATVTATLTGTRTGTATPTITNTPTQTYTPAPTVHAWTVGGAPRRILTASLTGTTAITIASAPGAGMSLCLGTFIVASDGATLATLAAGTAVVPVNFLDDDTVPIAFGGTCLPTNTDLVLDQSGAGTVKVFGEYYERGTNQ